MNYYDNQMTERAARAYVQRAAKSGHTPQQPSSGSSGREGDVVTLTNINGRLARYKVRRDRAGVEYIRFLD